MKGKSYNFFILFLCCFVFLGAFCFGKVVFAEEVNNSTEEEIKLDVLTIDQWMPDKNLQTVVANILNKPAAQITQKDMLSLTDIIALRENISSLEGLQYAKNLTYINFYDNHISDLTPISKLYGLTILWFGINDISDISMIQNLTNVSQINFDDNHISDLSSISFLPNLFHFTAQRQEVVLPEITIHTNTLNLPLEVKWGMETARFVIPGVNGIYNEDENNIGWTNLDKSGVLEYSWRFEGFGPFYGTARRAYTFIPLEAGTVTVRYLDTLGNSIHPDIMLKGNIGEKFISEQKTITDFTFQEIQGNSTGVFTDQAQEVTYIYVQNPIPAADVTVRYLDTLGNSIHPNIILKGNIGEFYISKQKEIEGYLFDSLIGKSTGSFTDQPQTISYLYTKDNIVIKDSFTETHLRDDSEIGNRKNSTGHDNNLPKQLPGLGEKKQQILMAFGGGLTGIALYFYQRKKTIDDK